MNIDFIHIEGYKSIKNSKVELKPINILIGSNGSGKSNFISFFEFLNQLYEQKLAQYIALRGGQEKMLFQGQKITPEIKAHISFNNEANGYSFELTSGDENMIFTGENLWYGQNPWSEASLTSESNIKFNKIGRGEYINSFLKSFKKFHFHDTSRQSPFTKMSHVENDKYFLYKEGGNLASFLYNIQENHTIVYQRIIKIIQSIAPYFSDFYFQPNEGGYVKLLWQSKYSSTVYGATDLSDGTIRFIALTVLFMQPKLPSTIIIDEPELGLHPVAIAKLAGMIKSVSKKKTQVILATQSADLVNHFEAEDVITVDNKNGESVFNRLNSNLLEQWLDEYSVGDLWLQNIIEGGQPNQ